jgi:quinol monooxygenase YgiN
VSILVVLELEAKPGSEGAMIEVLGRHLGDTRARQGCESVTVHQDHDQPTSIVLVERWASRADDDAYRAWRAGEGAISEMGPLVAAAPRIRYYDDVDA